MLDTIKRLCKEKNTTIVKMEEELGFGRKVIYRWDKTSPGVDKVKAVADYLGVTVDYILHGETHDVILEEEEDGVKKARRMLMFTTKDFTEDELLQAVRIIKAIKK